MSNRDARLRELLAKVDLSYGISLGVTPELERGTPQAYGIPPASSTFYKVNGRDVSLSAGAPINCSTLQITPHGNGTHTECSSHVAANETRIDRVSPKELLVAELITLRCEPLIASRETGPASARNDDDIITGKAIDTALSELDDGLQALIVRVDGVSTPHRNWSGTNPPYLTREAATALVRHGIEHLVIELPSIDREQDGGELLAHRAFWMIDEEGSERARTCTLTEMAFVPREVPDGPCVLRLDVIALPLDAAPSRPIIYTEPFDRD